MKDNKHIKTFEQHQETQLNENIKLLSLLKERIKSLQLDVNRIDMETIKGRLNAMYNQVERLIDKLKN